MPLRSDEIRDMSDGDINARLAELEEERFRLKFRSATEPLENPLRLRTIRRDIARLKTILRERQLAAGARGAGGGGVPANRPEGTRAGTRGRGQR
jgi:large subunit ribosomal protein L29